MSVISELIEELIDNADLYTKELHDLMYRAADTIAMLSEKARKPKQGEWIKTSDDWIDGTLGARYFPIHCSVCNYSTYDDSATNYCPNCGARMKGSR